MEILTLKVAAMGDSTIQYVHSRTAIYGIFFTVTFQYQLLPVLAPLILWSFTTILIFPGRQSNSSEMFSAFTCMGLD